jgi:hypothetical protein
LREGGVGIFAGGDGNEVVVERFAVQAQSTNAGDQGATAMQAAPTDTWQ